MLKKVFSLFIFFTVVSFGQSQQNTQSQLLSASPNAISVTLGGDFVITGSYPALYNERVDQFVTRMYNQTKSNLTQMVAENKKEDKNDVKIDKQLSDIENYQIRKVTLKRKNGKLFQIDLLKFRETGNFEHNPYLENDDILIFPPNNLKQNFFVVEGAVNKPGRYLYVEGDKLSDALLAAGGIGASYENIKDAEITRLSYDGEKMETLSIPLTDINYVIMPGDRIRIFAGTNFRGEYDVYVLGEVKNPGKVYLPKNGLKLKEVIERAGGFTNNAALNRAKIFSNVGAQFTGRLELSGYDAGIFTEALEKNLEYENAQMLRMSNITTDEMDNFVIENQIRILNEGSAEDFAKLSDPNSTISNYVVKNNDLIFVPAKTGTITVFGQVKKPGLINFKEGSNYSYYIDLVGGYGPLARPEEVMIVKGSSKRWMSVNEPDAQLEEGDMIYVPKQSLKTFDEHVAKWASYVGIIGGIASLILIAIQLSN